MLPLTAEDLVGLLEHFDVPTQVKGRAYFQKKLVASVECLPSSGGATIIAKVHGSRPTPYDVKIDIAVDGPDWVVNTECSCPMNFGCKHCVAAIFAAIKSLQQFPAQLALLPPKSATVAAQPTLSPEWKAWLERIKAAATPKAPETDDYPAGELQRLLYILKPPANGRPVEIELAVARLLKTGGFGQAQNYYASTIFNQHSPARFILRSDVALVRKLTMAQTYSSLQLKLEESVGAELLRDILATGRCKWRGAGPKHPLLSIGEERPAKAVWKTDAQGRQSPGFEVTPAVTDILPLSPLWYVDETTATCGPLQADLGAAANVWLSAPPLLPEHAVLMETELPKHRKSLPLPPPQRIEVQTIEGIKPVSCLRLFSILVQRESKFGYSLYEARHKHVNLARLEFDYNGIRLPNDYRTGTVERFQNGKLIRLERDPRSENAGYNRLTVLGLRDAESAFYEYRLGKNKNDFTFLDEDAWLTFVIKTVPQLRAEGWQIEVDPEFRLRIAEPEDWYTDAESSGIDWFGVEIGVQVEGKKINLLPLLLEQLQQRPRLLDPETLQSMPADQTIPIHLPDGRLLPFPASRLREMLGVLLELFGEKPLDKRGRLKLSKLRAAELTNFGEEAHWRWHGAQELKQLGDKLRDFSGIQTITPPESLKATLRPYQQEGLSWLQFLREYELGGILADDMGLGKTVQTLAHLLHEKEQGRADCPTLVVAPTSLMTNWRQETERFAPGLKLLVLHGLERKQHFEKLRDYDLIVTSYPLLPRDEAILIKEKFHYVILDEAQYIKNPKTKFAQIACQLQANHHLCLTGTPMENHLGELWSQFNFLLPGFLGDEMRFRKLFRNPIERNADHDRRKLLARRIAPFVLRRRKEDVAKELPPKTEIVQNVELTGAQRDLYETVRLAMHAKVREEISNKGMSRAHIVILDALLKLRQICCDPRLLKLDAARKVKDSAKLELLMDLLPEMLAEGRRILLFSQFTSMLELIKEELHKLKIDYALLTGETTDRATPIENFQSGKVPLFLISLKAGGTGLNLTAADTVIHYDPWWNPAVENQATDRAHRIGQTKSVFVYKLMTVGTVEERILELQKRKRELVEGLLDENRKESLKLSATDLDVLFAPLS